MSQLVIINIIVFLNRNTTKGSANGRDQGGGGAASLGCTAHQLWTGTVVVDVKVSENKRRTDRRGDFGRHSSTFFQSVTSGSFFFNSGQSTNFQIAYICNFKVFVPHRSLPTHQSHPPSQKHCQHQFLNSHMSYILMRSWCLSLSRTYWSYHWYHRQCEKTRHSR